MMFVGDAASLALAAIQAELHRMTATAYTRPPSDWNGYLERKGRVEGLKKAADILEACLKGKDPEKTDGRSPAD